MISHTEERPSSSFCFQKEESEYKKRKSSQNYSLSQINMFIINTSVGDTDNNSSNVSVCILEYKDSLERKGGFLPKMNPRLKTCC